MKEIKLFIDGEFIPSSESRTYITKDPANGEELAVVHLPSREDIDRAVESSERAFHSEVWRSMPAAERAQILLKISELIKERKVELIGWEMKDSGSTFKKASADIHNSASYFKTMSKVAQDFQSEKIDTQATRAGFSKNSRHYSPIGVCAQIIPWNFPLVMAAWKIGPILATGCTGILKSSNETPITASILAEILSDAKVPKGVVNIITGGANEGQYLTEHPKVKKIAFTGSTKVGKHLLQVAAQNVKRTTLELGGKSANIILDDADLKIAIDGALYAFLYHSGQACDSGTRLLVHEKIYSEFLELFLARIKEVKVGLTSDHSTGMGPVINDKQAKSILNYIELSKKEGAKLLHGGNSIVHHEFAKGSYIEPTVFEITPQNTIWHEEIFGPVVGITKFRSDEEAVSLANHSQYGLAGAIWSQNTERANTLAKKLEAGTVWINEYHLLNPGMPFGGFKESGLGREMGIEGLAAYFEVQHIWESDCNERSQKPWYDVLF